MKSKFKKLWLKIVAFCKYIWLECKDIKTLLLFIFYWLICGSPTWVGYILYLITKEPYHLIYANACIAFWAGPLTPEIPLCITLALGTRKLITRIQVKTKTKLNKPSQD